MQREPNYPARIFWLSVTSALIRLVLATSCNLSNDEAYYYTYARFPALSYFDHPGMVGWLIRVFTLNLVLHGEIYVRLASVALGTASLWLVYGIAKSIADDKAGWYAALLYTFSIYGFAFSGIFMLPDSPQVCFWLAALYSAIGIARKPEALWWYFCLGISLALALASKYTSVFLWAGIVAYFAFEQKKIFARPYFIMAQAIALLGLMPTLLWNGLHGFISFRFHGNRVDLLSGGFDLSRFWSEMLGEMLYTNPLIWLLIVVALLLSFCKPIPSINRMLLYISLPLVFLFLFVSLWRNTLPHWNGPGYIGLSVWAAVWLRGQKPTVQKISLELIASFWLITMVVVPLQIKQGIFNMDQWAAYPEQKPLRDVSLDLYGWDQLATAFDSIAKVHESQADMKAGSPLLSYRWFPAANLDFYINRDAKRKILVQGDTNALHNWLWYNASQGGFVLGSDAWYVTSNLDYKHPLLLAKIIYAQITPPDTVSIKRGGKEVYQFYVYRLKNLQAWRN